ncbi:MBOAT family protein [Pseudomonas sp.]|uniref:MBOAT family O-acyltransferase n=1 Tax=Pseudomonas sp. TaxID=306 RepID=UPI002606DD6C|nr:MBOAT family O-acyltransferase [Pseudomonas sp.]
MIFSSYSFLLIFLPIVFGFFLLLRHFKLERPALAMLVLASLAFYGVWSWRYLGLLLVLIFVNYGLGRQLVKHHKRFWLIVAVIFNLSVLAYFKYAGFFLSFVASSSTWHIILPLGISFFTFQKIAWHVDLYQRRLRDTGSLLDYSFFVCFFPQLIAGPIVHARVVFPQFARGWFDRPLAWQLGISLLTVGLMKKVLLADPLAPGVASLYDRVSSGGSLAGPDVLLAGLSYGLQLYFDFSGYADMAIGLGLMFGIKLPVNFRSPYKSSSIIEFWRRWHITLSGFLRDYLYIPLGGNRHGRLRASISVLLTMLLGGLWHGAGWQFLAWGALHGVLLVINHYWRQVIAWHLPRMIALPLTLVIVMLAWIPFRADSLADAFRLYQGLVDWHWTWSLTPSTVLDEVMAMHIDHSLPLVCLGLLIMTLITPSSRLLCLRLGSTGRGILVGIGLFLVLKALAGQPDRAFLYFNF